uniref:Uncharacterized protein n=1 Tax=Acrobeloides nanus TaxID=290746 RepID=A0A914BYU3_9BILA
MARFVNKVVIVTGSSSGIGQETAVHFAEEGATVVLVGRNSNGLKQTFDLIKKKNIPTDRILSIQGSIDEPGFIEDLINETIQKFGRLDILVNNAGVTQDPNEDANSIENLDYVFKVNVRSVVNLTQLAIPHLIKTNGCVVNVSSVSSTMVHKDLLFYSMTKAAVDQFTKGCAAKHAEQGLRFNSVNPGYTRTPIFTRNDPNANADEVLNKMDEIHMSQVVPMKRMGKVREISEAILFLASPAASYCNGTCMVIDGGYSCNTLPSGLFDEYNQKESFPSN